MEDLQEMHSRHHLRQQRKPAPHARLRTILNILFLVAAIVGLIW